MTDGSRDQVSPAPSARIIRKHVAPTHARTRAGTVSRAAGRPLLPAVFVFGHTSCPVLYQKRHINSCALATPILKPHDISKLQNLQIQHFWERFLLRGMSHMAAK
jgi:hypothetical protein